jgi:putative redox protein
MVTVRSLDALAQRIEAGQHVFVADEPEPLGQDRGPEPYDLLLAGIGACTATTLRLYAERHGWPLEGVEVALRHERTHGDDCQAGGSCRRVFVHVSLEGPLDEAQRARLLDVADRCPVARSVQAGIEIVGEREPEAVSRA